MSERYRTKERFKAVSHMDFGFENFFSSMLINSFINYYLEVGTNQIFLRDIFIFVVHLLNFLNDTDVCMYFFLYLVVKSNAHLKLVKRI